MRVTSAVARAFGSAQVLRAHATPGPAGSGGGLTRPAAASARSRRLPLLLLALLLVAAVFAAFRPGAPPVAAQDRDSISAPATHAHPMGTDALGRDRLVRTAAALLLGLTGATLAATAATAFAALFGTLAAFAPSPLATVLLLVSDAFLTLPWLFLLMIVRSGLPLTTTPLRSATVTFALLGALGWPACARAVFRGARALRAAPALLAGRAAGLRPAQLARLHVLPGLRPLLLPQFLVSIPALLIAEANLGTLGLGVAEPLPSFGGMLLEAGNSALLATTHWVYAPIVLLAAVLLLLERLVPATRSDST